MPHLRTSLGVEEPAEESEHIVVAREDFFIALRDAHPIAAAKTPLDVEERLLALDDDGRDVVIWNSGALEISDDVYVEALSLCAACADEAAR